MRLCVLVTSEATHKVPPARSLSCELSKADTSEHVDVVGTNSQDLSPAQRIIVG